MQTDAAAGLCSCGEVQGVLPGEVAKKKIVYYTKTQVTTITLVAEKVAEADLAGAAAYLMDQADNWLDIVYESLAEEYGEDE